MTITPTLNFDLDEKEINEIYNAINTMIKYKEIFHKSGYKVPESCMENAIHTLSYVKTWDIPNLEKQIER